MSNSFSPLRPGMTALAAVVALSSTPLFAQNAEAPAAETSPAIRTEPVLVTPPAAAAVSSSPIAVPIVQAAPVTVGPPTVVDLAPPAVPSVAATAPEPNSASVPAAQSAQRSVTQSSRSRTATVDVAPTAVRAAPGGSPETSTPVVPARVAAPVPLAKVQPAPVRQMRTARTRGEDDTLPVAAGIGLAALALAGGAFALRRRRRHDDADAVLVEDGLIPASIASTTGTEQVFVTASSPTPAVPVPSSVDGPHTQLPAGFDLSRFGRHVQAAYRGPTADNPSLSLSKRLKRASFFDQRERMGSAPRVGQPDRLVVMPAASVGSAVAPADGIARATTVRARPGLRPAFQG